MSLKARDTASVIDLVKEAGSTITSCNFHKIYYRYQCEEVINEVINDTEIVYVFRVIYISSLRSNDLNISQ